MIEWRDLPGCFCRDQPTCLFHPRLASAHGIQRSKSPVSSRWISLSRGRSGCQDLWPRRRILTLHIPRAAFSVLRKTRSLGLYCKWQRWWHHSAHSTRGPLVDREDLEPLSLQGDQQVLEAQVRQPDPSDPSSPRALALLGDLGWTSAATEPAGCLWSGWSPLLWPLPLSRGSRTPSDRSRASRSGLGSRRCSPRPGSGPPTPTPARLHKHQLRSSALCGSAVFSGVDGLPACLLVEFLQREEFHPLSCYTATSGDKIVLLMFVRKSNHPQLLRAAVSVQMIHLRSLNARKTTTTKTFRWRKPHLKRLFVIQLKVSSRSFCPPRCHRREWTRN